MIIVICSRLWYQWPFKVGAWRVTISSPQWTLSVHYIIYNNNIYTRSHIDKFPIRSLYIHHIVYTYVCKYAVNIIFCIYCTIYVQCRWYTIYTYDEHNVEDTYIYNIRESGQISICRLGPHCYCNMFPRRSVFANTMGNLLYIFLPVQQ